MTEIDKTRNPNDIIQLDSITQAVDTNGSNGNDQSEHVGKKTKISKTAWNKTKLASNKGA